MPFTPARVPAVVDKGKKSSYTNASEVTSARAITAISGALSSTSAVGSAKKAMQSAKGGNYALSLTKATALNASRAVKTISYELTNSGGAGIQDAFITQFNSGGSTNWTAKIGGIGGGNESVQGLSADSNGNINVVGQGDSSSTLFYNTDGTLFKTLSNLGGNDVFIAQYNRLGFINWAGRVACDGQDYAGAVCTDSNGNITLCGNYNFSAPLIAYDKNNTQFGTSLSTNGNSEVFVAQYSSTGSVNWLARVGGSADEYLCKAACVDSNGNITVSGITTSGDLIVYNKNGANSLGRTFSGRAWIAQYSSAGLVNWAARITGGTNVIPQAACVDSNGNITVTGWYNQTGALTFYDKNDVAFGTVFDANYPNHDTFIVQYSSTGSVNWVTRLLQEGGHSHGYGISADSNGNITLTGDYISGRLFIYDKNGTLAPYLIKGPGGYSAFIIQYSSAGLVNWRAQVGINYYDGGNAVSVDSAGNINVTGYCTSDPLTAYDRDDKPFIKTFGRPNTNGDTFIVQYSSTGYVKWLNVITGSASDTARAITSDKSGNVTVGGYFTSPTLINPPLTIYPSI